MFMLLLPTAVAFVPVLKADLFEYKITSRVGNLSVTFYLPTFETVANDISLLSGNNLSGTMYGQPVTAFGISGGDNSSVCDNGLISAVPGPCWVATSSQNQTDNISPSFSGPGTYTAGGTDLPTTVTITDISTSTVPEPSGVVLLASVLVAVGFVTRRRLASRQCGGGPL